MLSSINLGTGLGALLFAAIAAACGADVSYAIAAAVVTVAAGGGLYRARAVEASAPAAESSTASAA
jgi:hypothetical protein